MPTQMNLPTLVAEAVLAELARNPELYRSVTPGPKGEDLTLDSIVMEADYSMTLTFSDGTTYNTPPIRGGRGPKGVEGDQGPRGVGIHHTRWTATTNPEHHFGVAGHMDTYTLYGDEDELVVLGWFSVKNGENGKDPYDYAVEAGYEGTKDEFYKAIAENATHIEQIRNLISQNEHLFDLVETKGQEFIDQINQIIADFLAMKGTPGGFAGLDVNGKVPVEQIPDEVRGVIRVNTHADLPHAGVPRQLYLVVQDETAEGASTLYHWAEFEYRPATSSTTVLGLAELRELLAQLDGAKASKAELAEVADELQATKDDLTSLTELVGTVNDFRELAFVAHRMHLPVEGKDEVLYIVRSDETNFSDLSIYAWTIDGYRRVSGKMQEAINQRIEDLVEATDSDRDLFLQRLQDLADEKVDKVSGKQLSTEDFTSALKDKLIGLEGTHWRGTFVSLAALQAGVANPAAGDYADVDTGGAGVARYIWNATDSVWVMQSGAVASITESQVKHLYESNPDTNAFTDAERGKLGGIEAGAQVNTVASVNGRTGAVTGLVENADPRLSDSREWTASVVSQAEAEAGTATTARKWTSQRVRQAILGWWASSADKTKLDGVVAGATKNATDAQLRDRRTHTGTQDISTVSGLSAALDSKANTSTVSGLSAALDSKANTSTVSGLSTALDSKANTSTQVIAGTGLTGGGTLAADRTFNVSYGTTAGTAAQGNDSRLSDSREWTASVVSQAEAEAGTDTTARKWTAQRVAQAIGSLGLKIGTTSTTAAAGDDTRITGAVQSAGTGLTKTGTSLSVNYGTAAGTAAQGNDSRLSDSREWTATTVSQAEAEAGTASTRRAWTAQRVRQASDAAVDVLRQEFADPDKGAALVGFQQPSAGALVRTVQEKLSDTISIKDFGAGDGGDDTEKLRAAHMLANQLGQKVSYDGVKRVRINSNARIKINTSVDFARCVLSFVGLVPEENWSWDNAEFNHAFEVEDPDTPVITETIDFTGANLSAGSTTFCQGLIDGPAYVHLVGDTSIHRQSNRAADGTSVLAIPQYINFRGFAQHPLPFDLSGGNQIRTTQYRKFSKTGQVVLENIVFDLSEVNHMIAFYVLRNDVTIRHVRNSTPDGGYPIPKTRNVLFTTYMVAGLILDDVVMDGTRDGTDIGNRGATYVFQPINAANVTAKDLRLTGEWGQLVGNYVNGITYINPVAYRVDIHVGGYNMYVEGGELTSAVQCGMGGGLLSVDGTVFQGPTAVQNRVDYGGSFVGAIVVNNIKFKLSDSSGITIVDWSHGGGAGNTSIDTYLPDIVVVGVSLVATAPIGNNEIRLCSLRRAVGTSVVYAPSKVSFSNIQGLSASYIGADIRYGDFEMKPQDFSVSLVLTNITAKSLSGGISVPNSTMTVTRPCAVQFSASSVNSLRVNFGWRVPLGTSIIVGCSVGEFAVHPNSLVLFSGCVFRRTGSTPTLIGGPEVAEGRRITISGGFQGSGAIDYSYVSAIQGFINRGTGAVLPSGATWGDLFMGWRAASD